MQKLTRREFVLMCGSAAAGIIGSTFVFSKLPKEIETHFSPLSLSGNPPTRAALRASANPVPSGRPVVALVFRTTRRTSRTTRTTPPTNRVIRMAGRQAYGSLEMSQPTIPRALAFHQSVMSMGFITRSFRCAPAIRGC